MCEGFLQFEREEGTLETYEAALTRTAAQMERIKGRKEKVKWSLSHGSIKINGNPMP